MEPVLALAILSLGAFVTVLVTVVFYMVTVRARLLDVPAQPVPDTASEHLSGELNEQRLMIEQVNSALAHHAQQLTAAARAGRASGVDDLRGMLIAQTETVQSLNGLLREQSEHLSHVDARLSQQDTRLGRIETHLTKTRPAAAEPIGAQDALASMIQTQSERLVALSGQLEAWGGARPEQDAHLADHARILAQLDRELVAHAASLQQLDTRVSEQTTLIESSVEEHRKQSGILNSVHTQLDNLFSMVNLLLASPRAGQDRLTDINGIGPVYAGRLYEAGITTFRRLSVMTPEEILTLIDEPEWRERNIDTASWIQQAEHLASQREKVEKTR